MRGNETDEQAWGIISRVGFQIPMRGNEVQENPAPSDPPQAFQIPMRGNENFKAADGEQANRVPNPHEG